MSLAGVMAVSDARISAIFMHFLGNPLKFAADRESAHLFPRRENEL